MLEYYVIRPRSGTCEAVISYETQDPIEGSKTNTTTVHLDQKTDLNDKPDYTDADVALAVEAKHPALGKVEVPVKVEEVIPSPEPVEILPVEG